MVEDINSKSKVLIITGGHIEDDFLRECVMKEQYTMIIVADRGLIVAERINLPLDFIVGDFDSVTKHILAKYEGKTPVMTFPEEKDKTDTEIAIDLALSKGAVRIDLLGATGSRFDHTLANVHLLKHPMELGIDINILDSNNKIYMRNKGFTIKKEAEFGDFVSLIPFADAVEGLTLKGFKYPLNKVTMVAGTSLGISNMVTDDKAYVEFDKGILIVIESRD